MQAEFAARQWVQAPQSESESSANQLRDAENWRLVEQDLEADQTIWPLREFSEGMA